MRSFIAIVLFTLGLAGPAAAYDDPKALIEAIYAPYQAGQRHTEGVEQFYSSHLRGLLAGNLERHTASPDGAPLDPNAPSMLDFNPFIEGDNALLLDLNIGEPIVTGEKAMVPVTFHNFDHTSLLAISAVREADGWKIDDIAAMGQGENWLLSWLLQYDPFSVN
ncbi:hypothetical protein [Devosia sp.]|uniref:hypothetical protein n=1 Tax=Devosia sp. TaxID=1871048 RepID=UPI003A92A7A6